VAGSAIFSHPSARGEVSLLTVFLILASLGIWTRDCCAGASTASATQPIAATVSATPSATSTAVPKLALFVTNSDYLPLGSRPVTVYPLGSSGNIAPLSTETGTSQTGLYHPSGIARDSKGNLYATNGSSVDSVTVYSASAVGDSRPLATIKASDPQGIALDSMGNIYVTSRGGITVFAAGEGFASANIGGDATGLSNPTGIAVDSSGKIYVANYGDQDGAYSVLVFRPAVMATSSRAQQFQESARGWPCPWA